MQKFLKYCCETEKRSEVLTWCISKMLCQTKAIEDYTNRLQSGHSQENKILKAMQCYVEQGILPCFWALCMGFLFRLVFMQLRMAQCVDQLIRLPLWVYRSLDQRLIHGYTKVLYVWKPGFVEIIVEIISANYRILRRVRPVCLNSLYEPDPLAVPHHSEKLHRKWVWFSFTANGYKNQSSFAFTGQYKIKIAIVLNKFCIENGANDVSWRHVQ